MTLPLTITITATTDDRYRAETPNGPVEAGSLRELGDRLRDFLAYLEDESASDLIELARLSRSATDRATLLELARTSPPPTPGSATTDRGRRPGERRAMSKSLCYGQIVRIRMTRHGTEKLRPVVVVTPDEAMAEGEPFRQGGNHRDAGSAHGIRRAVALVGSRPIAEGPGQA